MNFSFKGKPAAAKKSVSNPFAEAAETEVPIDPNAAAKPLDYLQFRAAFEKAEAEHEQAVFDGEEPPPVDEAIIEEKVSSKLELEALLRRRRELLSAGSRPEERATGSTANLKVAGLIKLDADKDPSVRVQSKHIGKMVETAKVNDTFRNLLKMKIADRDKDKAEAEFGARPEEFVTSAYLKQKQASVELEKQLEAKEAGGDGKKDVSNMFREMLGSGSYARTNVVAEIVRPKDPVTHTVVGKTSDAALASSEPSREMVERVLHKVAPDGGKEVAKAIEDKARQEALRIIGQIDQMAEDDDETSRLEARMSAKERFLMRKRQKLDEQ